jgi:hypothetical protein
VPCFLTFGRFLPASAGVYARNLPYIQEAHLRWVQMYSESVARLRGDTGCVGSGIEDHHSPLPHSVDLLQKLLDYAEKVVAIEALTALCAVKLRLRSKEISMQQLGCAVRNLVLEFDNVPLPTDATLEGRQFDLNLFMKRFCHS